MRKINHPIVSLLRKVVVEYCIIKLSYEVSRSITSTVLNNSATIRYNT